MSEQVNNEAVTVTWRSAFEEDIKVHLKQVGCNTDLITEEAHNDMMLLMLNMEELSIEATRDFKSNRTLKDEPGLKAALAKKAMHNRWQKRLELLNDVLVFTKYATVEEAQVVSHTGRIFDDLVQCHVLESAHAGHQNTDAKVKQKHGKSIPRHAIQLFLNNCDVLRKTETIKKLPSGSTPIVSKMFMERIQMDCVDMQGFLLHFGTLLQTKRKI